MKKLEEMSEGELAEFEDEYLIWSREDMARGMREIKEEELEEPSYESG